jgi:hypothetical protein
MTVGVVLLVPLVHHVSTSIYIGDSSFSLWAWAASWTDWLSYLLSPQLIISLRHFLFSFLSHLLHLRLLTTGLDNSFTTLIDGVLVVMECGWKIYISHVNISIMFLLCSVMLILPFFNCNVMLVQNTEQKVPFNTYETVHTMDSPNQWEKSWLLSAGPGLPEGLLSA